MSKRVRSSLSDGRLEGRGSVPTRQGPLANSDKTSPLEKEKTCARPSVTVSGLSEDKIRGLSTGGEGCEKNLKRKRSLGTMLNRGNDADRDVKPTGQRSSANEARPGPSDGLAFRYRASAGAVAGSKMDSSSQQNNIGSRVLSKIDVDYATLPNERRVRHAGLEKEDAMVKETRYILQIEAQVPRQTPKHAGHQEQVHLSWAHLLPSNVQLQEAMKHLIQIKPTFEKHGQPQTFQWFHTFKCFLTSYCLGWSTPTENVMDKESDVVSPVSNFDEVLSDGSPLDTAARSAPIESCSVLLTKNVTSSNTQTVTRIDNISLLLGCWQVGDWLLPKARQRRKLRIVVTCSP